MSIVLFVLSNFNKRWFLTFKLDCFFIELFNDDGDSEDDNASQAFGKVHGCLCCFYYPLEQCFTQMPFYCCVPSSPSWAFGINLWFLIQPLWGFWEFLNPSYLKCPRLP